jgi:hypothetical protein
METDKKIQYPEMPPVPDYRGQQRDRTFPVHFIPTPEGSVTLLFDGEFQEWWAKVEAWRKEVDAIDASIKASREAELAAGRPPVYPDNPQACPEFAENDRRAADSNGCPDPGGTGTLACPEHPAAQDSNPCLPGGRGRPSPDSSRAAPDTIDSTLASCRTSLAHTSTTPAPPPDLVRHSRYCTICSHPDRDAIEGDFVRWRSPAKIAEDFGINDRRIVYRHAHATGLFDRRTREVARILEQYMELVDHHLPDNPDKFDFDSVTRAVRVYAHLSPGLWFEPVRTHQILTGPILPQVQPAGAGIESSPQIHDVTPTRHESVPRSKTKKCKRSRKKKLENSQNGTRHIPEAELEPTL